MKPNDEATSPTSVEISKLKTYADYPDVHMLSAELKVKREKIDQLKEMLDLAIANRRVTDREAIETQTETAEQAVKEAYERFNQRLNEVMFEMREQRRPMVLEALTRAAAAVSAAESAMAEVSEIVGRMISDGVILTDWFGTADRFKPNLSEIRKGICQRIESKN
jgi:hypothetical protein